MRFTEELRITSFVRRDGRNFRPSLNKWHHVSDKNLAAAATQRFFSSFRSLSLSLLSLLFWLFNYSLSSVFLSAKPTPETLQAISSGFD